MIDILSSREIEVFKLQADKKDNEIAKKLGISEKSVVAYRKKIKDKGFYFNTDTVIN